MPQAPEYTRRPLSSIMRRSNRRNTAAEGEWMVAQTVMPPAASAATAVMTCAHQGSEWWHQLHLQRTANMSSACWQGSKRMRQAGQLREARLCGGERVQPRRRLVQEQHARVGYKRNADVHALGLAACAAEEHLLACLPQ